MEAARGQSASDNHVDGNALAGAFAELFTTDITVATTECAQCGCIGPVACLVVYADAPGYVARCQECGGGLEAGPYARDCEDRSSGHRDADYAPTGHVGRVCLHGVVDCVCKVSEGASMPFVKRGVWFLGGRRCPCRARRMAR